MKTTQEYQHESFLNRIEFANNDTEKLSQPDVDEVGSSSEDASSSSSSSSAKKALAREKQRQKYAQSRPQMPHYWPADKVPYIGITYCEFTQYLFAFFFISVLIWIFVGLRHFGNKNSQDNVPQSVKILADSIKSQKLQQSTIKVNNYEKGSFQAMMLENENVQFEGISDQNEQLNTGTQKIMQETEKTLLNRAISEQAPGENAFLNEKKPLIRSRPKQIFEIPQFDQQIKAQKDDQNVQ